MNIELAINRVYTFKLTSGEELIAKIVCINDQWITVTNPVSVAPGPQGMGLVPAMFTVEPGSNSQLNIHNITIYAPTDDAVTSRYIEATTGLRIPEKKIVMG